MKIKLPQIVLIFILLVSAVLRIYKLDTVPPHITSDEAALGYNAYSILKTGKDEYGTVLPIVFKSFGDYKPGLYVYATVPFVALLGLNEFSVRLPGALLGVLSVFLIYLVTKEMFSKRSELLSLIAAAFLAISPWHMFFSRGAWEINLSLTLTLAAIYYFLKAKDKGKYLLLSAFFFGLTLLAYQGAKLSSAIVLVLLIIFYWSEFKKISKKYIVGSMIVGFIVSIPIVVSVFTGQAGRLAVFSVFSGPRPEKYLQNFLDQGGEHVNDFNYSVFHPEWLNFLRGIMGRWFNHFSGRFLFFEGDWSNPRHSAPFAGELTVFDLPLLLLGGFALFRKNLRREHGFILGWLILASLPAILSRDAVHAVRSFNMVIPLTLVVSYGFYTLYNILPRKIFMFGFIVLYLGGLVYYLDMYFVHLPKLNSKYWEYGYKQIVESVTPLESQYNKIIFQQSFTQPYIYFLFFNKYDPAKYQAEANKNFIPSPYGDVGQISKLDNISFEGIDWQVLRGKSGTLVVGDSERIPAGDSQEGAEFHVVSSIKYLDGTTDAFRIIKIK